MNPFGERHLLALTILLCANCAKYPADTGPGEAAPRIFAGHGVIVKIDADRATVVIKHQAIDGYMDAMTMPFHARNVAELKALQPGDAVSFRLHVNEAESWVDDIQKTGEIRLAEVKAAQNPSPAPAEIVRSRNPLPGFAFTNELGQAVSLSQWRGQALAITFFFTRCPVPDFCPRLSRNFEEASRRLASLPGTPTNWHFLSISFDPEFDTPAVLKAYGERYHYDPAHWSFLTGPVEKVNELARLSGVEVKGDSGLFDHNFRTLIVDAAGELQATFPFGGNLSDAIVHEMLKAVAATNAQVRLNSGEERTAQGTTNRFVPERGGSQTLMPAAPAPR